MTRDATRRGTYLHLTLYVRGAYAFWVIYKILLLSEYPLSPCTNQILYRNSSRLKGVTQSRRVRVAEAQNAVDV